MRQVLPYFVLLAGGCSATEQAKPVAAVQCPSDLGLSEIRTADIIVAGKWVPAKPDITTNGPIKIGSIQASEIKKGALEKDDLVSILIGEIRAPNGEIVKCAIAEPGTGDERLFFIKRSRNSLEVVNHQLNDAGT